MRAALSHIRWLRKHGEKLTDEQYLAFLELVREVGTLEKINMDRSQEIAYNDMRIPFTTAFNTIVFDVFEWNDWGYFGRWEDVVGVVVDEVRRLWDELDDEAKIRHKRDHLYPRNQPTAPADDAKRPYSNSHKTDHIF